MSSQNYYIPHDPSFRTLVTCAPGDVPVRRVATKLIYPLATWRLLNGKKIFASLSEAATHYGILCTEEKPQLSRADAMYVAVPAQSEGFGFAMPAVGR